jgi:transcriptional regulator with XRE-family HTH domain
MSKLERLWAKFKSRSFRESYVESHLSTNVANQIATMREARGWTQAELAARAGLKQSQISALENPSQRTPSAKMMLKVARALDVAVAARFVRYSEIACWAVDPDQDKIDVTPFLSDDISRSLSLKVDVTTNVRAEPYFTWVDEPSASPVRLTAIGLSDSFGFASGQTFSFAHSSKSLN